jgi:hypothetical protein
MCYEREKFPQMGSKYIHYLFKDKNGRRKEVDLYLPSANRDSTPDPRTVTFWWAGPLQTL